MRYLLTISYDGTDFAGYQVQPGKRTVQSELESALEKVLGQRLITYASGRTDSGVHAWGQVAHFDIDKELNIKKVQHSLNAFLPFDLKVISLCLVDDNLHARFSPKSKTYQYRIYLSSFDFPLLVGRTHRVCEPLDLQAMCECAQAFVGTHDFVNYAALHSTATTSVRTIFECSVALDDGIIKISISGNGYLYKMVRNIAGVLVQVGKHKLSLSDITNSLAGGELPRNVTLPACGLYLMKVEY